MDNNAEGVPASGQPYSQLLADYAAYIRTNLFEAGILRARAAYYLHRAHDTIKSVPLAMRGAIDFRFPKWFDENIGRSKTSAYRLMRWVHPFIQQIKWDDDEDPLLKELADIGPSRCEIAYKFGDSFQISENNRFVIRVAEVECFVAELTYDDLIVLYQRTCSKPQKAKSTSGSTGVATEATSSSGTYQAPQLSQSTRATGQTVRVNSAPSVPLMSHVNDAGSEAEQLSETGDGEQAPPPNGRRVVGSMVSLQVLNSYPNSNDNSGVARVHGLNVSMNSERNPVPNIDTVDAICAIHRIDGSRTLHWWDHEARSWEVIQLANEAKAAR